MQKRGPIVGLAGAIITGAAFLAALAIVPDIEPSLGGGFLLSELLSGVFDKVSDEVTIYPQSSHTFDYGATVDIPILWGLQILDYQNGDTYAVKVSNVYGDDLGSFAESDPFFFDMFVVEDSGTLTFEVQNTGDSAIGVVMMFSEDPDNSEMLSDSDSPLISTLIPIAVAGIMMIVGIMIVIAGAILTLVDWKKTKDRSGNF